MRYFFKALFYHLETHRANLPNLIAGALGMISNNLIFLVGIWAMLFSKKDESRWVYFLLLTGFTMVSWGTLSFFAGGLRALGEIVESGKLETYLATPRNPLLLLAPTRTNPMALGDLIMGFFIFIFLGVRLGWSWFLKGLLISGIASIGFASVFILTGSIPFFIRRGGALGEFFLNMFLSLTAYPTYQIFSPIGRQVILITPVAVTSLIPMQWVLGDGDHFFFIAILLGILWLYLSIQIFQLGLKRYQSLNLVRTN